MNITKTDKSLELEMYLLEVPGGYRFYLTGQKPFVISKEYYREQINYFIGKGYQLKTNRNSNNQ